MIDGAPVGVELERYYLKDVLAVPQKSAAQSLKDKTGTNDLADGSIIMIVATDAPLDHRQLSRMAARTMMGLARTGSSASNGSGDYAIAFSTAPDMRISLADNNPRAIKVLPNDAMSPLFLAVIEATEEAIYNSLFRATSITGYKNRTIEALPIDKTIEILRRNGKIK